MSRRILLLLALPLAAQTQSGTPPDGAAIYRRACAFCHEQSNIDRMPARAVIARMSPEAILGALNTGIMAQQAQALSPVERRAVAEFLAGRPLGNELPATPPEAFCKVKPDDLVDPLKGSVWNGWGVDIANTRHQPDPGLSAAEVARLKPKWVFAFPGAISVNMQPVIAGRRVFIGGRTVLSLDARTGCVIWEFKPETSVRAAITIAKPDGADRWLAYVGDGRTNIYALDAATGELQWKTKSDHEPVSRITGAPKVYANRIYVPISSAEDGPSVNPKYDCCKYSGAVVALDALTGKILWTARTVTEPNQVIGKTKAGADIRGPSGASVWNSPTIDPRRNAVYAGTGNNHSNPPTATSDSIMAWDMETGKPLWVSQRTKGGDPWNIACSTGGPNCPENQGPDHDIGNSAILVNLKNGKRALVFGQKSGEVHAIDPDEQGKLLWSKRIGTGGTLGGVEWGGTSDGVNYYVPLSDVRLSPRSPDRPRDRKADPKQGGGLFAFDVATGKQLWHVPPKPCPEDRLNCSPAQSQAASSMPGVVFSGSVDGHLRAYAAKDGKLLWEFDTIRDFETVNGVKGRGGSLDAAGPAIAGGMVFVGSGYSNWGGNAGNVLIAFSKDGK